MPNESPLYSKLIALIDEANAHDPRLDEWQSKTFPKEQLYGLHMSEMLTRFNPNASEAVKIACRAQHIERWKSPRDSHPLTKEGYFKWRIALYQFHATRCGELMEQVGYSADMIDRVKLIVGKKNIKTNPESQMMEDVAGMVFIEYYMYDFSKTKQDYTEEKWMTIIQKTWKKLSPEAHAFILSGKVKLPEPLKELISKALC